jgi:hypothetical protein
MNNTYCPLCQSKLEVIDVAPCWECGHLPVEIEHARARKHSYAEMRVFRDLTVLLCNFCQVDFGSSTPEYFGLPTGSRIGYQTLEFVREIPDVYIGKDKWCPECGHRLAFLEFVENARIWAASQQLRRA